jgi:DNA-binding protein H-NS
LNGGERAKGTRTVWYWERSARHYGMKTTLDQMIQMIRMIRTVDEETQKETQKKDTKIQKDTQKRFFFVFFKDGYGEW